MVDCKHFRREPSEFGDGDAGSKTFVEFDRSQRSSEIIRAFDKSSEFEIAQLKKELNSVRDESHRVTAQNHRIMSELETKNYELQAARQKLRELIKDHELQKHNIPALEERVKLLETDVRRYDRRQRDAEKKLEHCQKELSDKEHKLSKSYHDASNLRQQVKETIAEKARVEKQFKEAMSNLEELTLTLCEYRQKTKDKMKKQSNNETSLQQGVKNLENERDSYKEQFLKSQQQISLLKEEIIHHEKQISEDKRKCGDLINYNTSLESTNADLYCKLNEHSIQKQQFEETIKQLKAIKVDNEEHLCTLRASNAALKSSAAADKERLNESLHETAKVKVQLEKSELINKQLTERIELLKANLALFDAESFKDDQFLKNFTKSIHTDDGLGIQSVERTYTTAEPDLHKVSNLLIECSLMKKKVGEYEQQLCKRNAELETVQNRLLLWNNQLKESKQELAERDAAVMKLEKEMLKKSKEASRMDKQVTDLKNKLSLRNQAVNDLEIELREKSRLLTDFQSELDSKGNRCSYLSEEIIMIQRMHKEQTVVLQNQLSETQRNLSGVSHSLEENQRQLEGKKNEISEKQAKLDDILPRLKQAQKDLTHLKAVHDDLKEHVSLMESDKSRKINQLQSNLEQSKDELQKVVQHCADLSLKHQLEMSQKNGELDQFKELLRKFEFEKLSHDQEQVDLKNNNSHFHQMLQSSEQRVTELELLKSEADAKLSELETELFKERENYSISTRELTNKLNQCHEELERRHVDVQEVERALLSKESAISDLFSKCKELEDENFQLRKELEHKQCSEDNIASDLHLAAINQQKLSLQLVDREKLISVLKEDFDSDQNQISHLQKQLSDLEHKCSRLQNENHHSKRQIASKEEAFDNLKLLADEMKRTLLSREEELNSLRTSYNEIKMELAKNLQQKSDLETQQEDLTFRLTQLNSQLQKCESDLTSTRTALASKENCLTNASMSMNEKEEKIASLTEQFITLNTQHGILEDNYHTSKITNHRLIDEADKLRHENMELSGELKTLQMLLEKSHNNIAELESTNQEINKKFKDKVSELDALIVKLEAVSVELDVSKDMLSQQNVLKESFTEEVSRLKLKLDALRQQHNSEIEIKSSNCNDMKLKSLSDQLKKSHERESSLNAELSTLLEEIRVLKQSQVISKPILTQEQMSDNESASSGIESIIKLRQDLANSKEYSYEMRSDLFRSIIAHNTLPKSRAQQSNEVQELSLSMTDQTDLSQDDVLSNDQADSFEERTSSIINKMQATTGRALEELKTSSSFASPIVTEVDCTKQSNSLPKNDCVEF